jgi:hypothetical protein
MNRCKTFVSLVALEFCMIQNELFHQCLKQDSVAAASPGGVNFRTPVPELRRRRCVG